MNEQTIYALGFFDGVHLGHQALLKSCRELADRHGCNAGAVTFASHPQTVLSGNVPSLINTKEDKADLLCLYGMDSVLELPFDKTIQTTHWSVFLQQLMAGGAAGFVCGSDFRFGAGGLGTAKKLAAFCQKHKLPHEIVPQQELRGIRVSSTHIRTLLELGDMEEAARFLGHPHILTGTVEKGKQIGRAIGFPTANISYPSDLVQLKKGVYACKVWADGKAYDAVTNIGTRPTVNGKGVNAEAFLLDFQGDLYGKTIKIAFYQFLRPEEKFSSLEELQKEIQKNALQTRKFFEKSE